MTKRGILSIIAFIAAEAVLFWFYLGHGSAFHWFTHFYAGASFALLTMAVLGFVRHPLRRPLLWVFLTHLFAAIPDALFAAGIPHARWMDVFLLHVSSHFIPGRNWTWYAVFLVTLGLYLWTRHRAASKIKAPQNG